MTTTTPPDALLLIATGCAHCPVVLQGLSDLVKQGAIGKLEVVNIAARPEMAAQHGVRAVPWLRLGGITLTGLRSPAELRDWAAKAGSAAGLAAWLNELLTTGERTAALAAVRESPLAVDALAQLLRDPATSLHVQVGIGSILEELAGSDLVRALLPTLAELTQHTDARLRADACHYLTLTGDPAVKAVLQKLLDDPDATVREVAEDSLAAIRKA
jgi:thioredoxin-like negative regulator of GroEL